MLDAGIPMPAASASIPMPSYRTINYRTKESNHRAINDRNQEKQLWLIDLASEKMPELFLNGEKIVKLCGKRPVVCQSVFSQSKRQPNIGYLKKHQPARVKSSVLVCLPERSSVLNTFLAKYFCIVGVDSSRVKLSECLAFCLWNS
jgi:hypothetical protein